MGRLTTGMKAQRVLRFLHGVKHTRIATMLAAHGFTQEALDEGWRLLRRVCGERLSVVVLGRGVDSLLLMQLDAWENKWFVIGQATLTRHFPAIAAQVFLNLGRTEGVEVIVAVGTFVERIEALAATAEGQAARALLAARGLDDVVIADAKAMLTRVGTIEASEPVPEPTEEEMAAAEAAMWAWYLEWSAVARTAIPNRNLLLALGFTRPRAEEEEEEPQPPPPAPVAPV